jgi:hypothetical protein
MVPLSLFYSEPKILNSELRISHLTAGVSVRLHFIIFFSQSYTEDNTEVTDVYSLCFFVKSL